MFLGFNSASVAFCELYCLKICVFARAISMGVSLVSYNFLIVLWTDRAGLLCFSFNYPGSLHVELQGFKVKFYAN